MTKNNKGSWSDSVSPHLVTWLEDLVRHGGAVKFHVVPLVAAVGFLFALGWALASLQDHYFIIFSVTTIHGCPAIYHLCYLLTYAMWSLKHDQAPTSMTPARTTKTRIGLAAKATYSNSNQAEQVEHVIVTYCTPNPFFGPSWTILNCVFRVSVLPCCASNHAAKICKTYTSTFFSVLAFHQNAGHSGKVFLNDIAGNLCTAGALVF